MNNVIIDSSDRGKTKIEILMDLIYETNKVRIPEEHIRYGTPVPLDQRPDDQTDENTYIAVVIDQDYDDRLSKQGGFLYRRQDLSDFFSRLSISITATEFPFTLRSVWASQIAPQLPYPIDAHDIEDLLIVDYTQVSILAKTIKGSLIFTGEVVITINPINPIFFKLVPIPFLTGFVEYAA